MEFTIEFSLGNAWRVYLSVSFASKVVMLLLLLCHLLQILRRRRLLAVRLRLLSQLVPLLTLLLQGHLLALRRPICVEGSHLVGF
jgi:hypothetical protein